MADNPSTNRVKLRGNEQEEKQDIVHFTNTRSLHLKATQCPVFNKCPVFNRAF